jgi:hypothetical protein
MLAVELLKMVNLGPARPLSLQDEAAERRVWREGRG